MTDEASGRLVERARAHLGDEPTDWLDGHGLLTLFADPPTCVELRKAQARRLLVAAHVVAELEAISGRGSVLVMKGAEIAALYPDPTGRPSRDLDVLVRDPLPLWQELRSRGYVERAGRRLDIDHHHLPPLTDPSATLGIELHVRPNTPAWASLPGSAVFESAEPSRLDGWTSLRPSDDVHALLMALHAWKGGFTKLRDLFDAALLAETSSVPVEQTAARFGLSRFWTTTVALTDELVLGGPSRPNRVVSRLASVGTSDARRRTRARILTPFAVAAPWRVAASHVSELRLACAARRSPGTVRSLPDEPAR